jgi:hypothetical protein
VTAGQVLSARRPQHRTPRLGIEIVETAELSGGEEIVALVADGALDAALPIAAGDGHWVRIIMIACCEGGSE